MTLAAHGWPDELSVRERVDPRHRDPSGAQLRRKRAHDSLPDPKRASHGVERALWLGAIGTDVGCVFEKRRHCENRRGGNADLADAEQVVDCCGEIFCEFQQCGPHRRHHCAVHSLDAKSMNNLEEAGGWVRRVHRRGGRSSLQEQAGREAGHDTTDPVMSSTSSTLTSGSVAGRAPPNAASTALWIRSSKARVQTSSDSQTSI